MSSTTFDSALRRIGATRHRAGALATLFCLLTAATASAAPAADPWPRWTTHDASSTAQIDHRAWTGLLATYLATGDDGVARFAYGAVTAVDRNVLEEYVAELAAMPIGRFNRREQLAYWVNLYNALTVRVILDHWPVRSIRDIDISPGWFADGPWGKALVMVEGEALTLDDIEHRILRPIWRDPRIHYVVNCASVGCPNLPAVALTADNADRLMTEAATAYVNHPRGARVEDGRLIVSSLYAWFEADFGGSPAGVLDHLRRYARPPLAKALAGRSDYDDREYDWSLNGR